MRYGSLCQKDAQPDPQDKVKPCHISEPRRHDASLRSNREKLELKPQPFTGKGGGTSQVVGTDSRAAAVRRKGWPQREVSKARDRDRSKSAPTPEVTVPKNAV